MLKRHLKSSRLHFAGDLSFIFACFKIFSLSSVSLSFMNICQGVDVYLVINMPSVFLASSLHLFWKILSHDLFKSSLFFLLYILSQTQIRDTLCLLFISSVSLSHAFWVIHSYTFHILWLIISVSKVHVIVNLLVLVFDHSHSWRQESVYVWWFFIVN